MRDSIEWEATALRLFRVVYDLGHDEVNVLTAIAERLKMGKRQYGPLVIARDLRDFRGKEAREEVEDALVYFACAWLRDAGRAS